MTLRPLKTSELTKPLAKPACHFCKMKVEKMADLKLTKLGRFTRKKPGGWLLPKYKFILYKYYWSWFLENPLECQCY